MSASAPSLPENNSEGRWLLLWFGLSLAAHAVILGWLAFVPPHELRVAAEGSGVEPQPAVSASAQRIEQVSAQIQATQADEVRSKVEELFATQRALSDLQSQTQSEFSNLALELIESAPQKTTDALMETLEAQARAEQAETEAATALEAMNQLAEAAAVATGAEEKAALQNQAASAVEQAKAAQEKAKDAQAEATSSQLAATQQLGFYDTGFEEARAAQAAATEAQADANHQQDNASKLAGELAAAKRTAERARELSARAQRAVELSETRLAAREREMSNLSTSKEQQSSRLEQLKAATNNPNAAREIPKVEKALAASDERETLVRAELKKLEEKVTEEKAKAKEAVESAAAADVAMKEAPAKLLQAQTRALAAQQKARMEQAGAQASATKAFASTSAMPQSGPAVPPAAAEYPTPALDGKSFAELYALAVEAEKKIAAEYQAIRAAQVAIQKQIPISEAQKYVQLALPVRDGLAMDANAPVRDAKRLEQQNAEIEKALQVLESMLSLSRGMAYQAQNTATRSGEMGMAISAESMKAQAAQTEQLSTLAAENESQAAIDLTALMRQILAGEFPGEGAEAAGNSGGQPGGAQIPGVGPQGGVGTNVSGRPGYGASGGVPSFPPTGAVLDSIPGRKVHGSGYGIGAKWMYIDSWWVIGPFPNPQRRNIETRFPPESVVDLDASYVTDDGSVRWQFVQNNQAMVRPPNERSYSIYYAYTELWFDEESDLWIAMGSDDYSKIWINDLPVWASGMQHKPWRANEGYRKVHFKKGLNRILMRVENGQASCMFSLMLCMRTNP